MSDHTLADYGWVPTSSVHLPTGADPARVLRVDGSTLLAIDRTGHRVLPLSPRLAPQPTVGDWIAVTEERIVAVLPRSSLLRRAAPDGGFAQALAANVDVVLIVCGADRPIRAGRIQRAVAQSWDAGASPVIVVTKTDLAPPDLGRIAASHPGVPVVAASALGGTGIDDVRAAIAGRTAVLLGESGAGKSTLANALLGHEVANTAEVRSSDRKGRHTTTARNLHPVPDSGGGTVIDTPGLRSLGLFADPEAVDASFAEIAEFAHSCRFSDCGHSVEPGCAVLAAVESGEMPAERYESWRRLQREAMALAMRQSPHEQRRHAKKFARVAKQEAERKRRF